jgi:zinc protease
MKINKIIILVFVFCIFGCVNTNTTVTIEELKSVRDAAVVTPKFSPPSIETFSLDNNIKVYHAQDDEVPLFGCTLIFPRGSLDRQKHQLASYLALGSMMRAGGVEGLTSDQLDLELQKLSASISVSVGAEVSAISFSGLNTDFNNIASLAKKVWKQPVFSADRISLWKSQVIESIARRKESPEGIAGTAFSQILYKGALIANPITRKEAQSLTQSDLKKLHADIFRSDGMKVLINGAIDKNKAQKLLSEFFGDEIININYEPVRPVRSSARDISELNANPGIYFIQKPFKQASVYLGILGPKRLTPDYPEIDVFNGILGSDGEFSSMLVQEVRSRLGLSYSIVGGVFPDEPIGRSFIGLQTKNESVGLAVKASIDTVNLISKGDFPRQLFQDVKTSISNSYVFGFDSIDSVASRRVFQELLGYPKDYDSTYLSKIASVTDNQISDVAKKYWDIKKAIIVVVGDKNAKISLLEARAKRWLPNLPIKELTFEEQLAGL